ncbi:MAG: NUDIX hydrolase N-terminal domain-containing protein [Clostridiales bacterium]
MLKLLEEIRSIAKNGLYYAKDHYDVERYNKLLKIANREYSEMVNITEEVITERFKNELGHITPKLGTDAAIFDDSGKILLVKRTDDNLWSLPCGWAEVNELPRESIKREVKEETGLNVEVNDVIDVIGRLPGDFDSPHTSCHILFYCIVKSGEIRTSEETSQVMYRNINDDINWHRDHNKMAKIAYRYKSQKLKRLAK